MATKGEKLSAETRANMAAAQKARWADIKQKLSHAPTSKYVSPQVIDAVDATRYLPATLSEKQKTFLQRVKGWFK